MTAFDTWLKKMKKVNMLTREDEKYVYSAHTNVLESSACLAD